VIELHNLYIRSPLVFGEKLIKSPIDIYVSCDKIYVVRTQGDVLQPQMSQKGAI